VVLLKINDILYGGYFSMIVRFIQFRMNIITRNLNYIRLK